MALFVGPGTGGSVSVTLARIAGQQSCSFQLGGRVVAGFEGIIANAVVVGMQTRHRPNNDGTGTNWTRNWTTGRDATRPMPFKGLFGPPFASRSQRNFLVRR